MAEATVNYLDPKVLAAVQNLGLQAKLAVEGYVAGMHRSTQQGFAVEFAQHREYVPGDDIKHVDWKVYGRTERFYLKQYDQETNLVAWLIVDSSHSMSYGSAGVRKYDYATMAAAALAHLIVGQSDTVGLAIFDAQLRKFLRPAATPTHLKEIFRSLSDGTSSAPSRLGPSMHEIAARIRQRGIVMIFSDLLDDVPSLLGGLRHLRFDRQEVVVFHVMDPAEVEFPFDDPTLFRGLELPLEVLADPRGLRESYLREFEAFRSEVVHGCRALNVDYVPLRTDENLGRVLARYLAHRAGKVNR